MAPAPRCAYCRERSAVPEYRPFCSRRCKMADLGRWLSGDYRIPDDGVPADADPDEDATADDPALLRNPDRKPTR
jgi:endogenous inhibitor of DNA gyrase (YacG/DUF329 family)